MLDFLQLTIGLMKIYIYLFYFGDVFVQNNELSLCFPVGLVKHESSHSSCDPASCRRGPFPESGVEERLR